jgi:hypothetical protein
VLPPPNTAYRNYNNWDKMQKWAKCESLQKTQPQEVFAIGRQYPTLEADLNIDAMSIVATNGFLLNNEVHAFSLFYFSYSRRSAAVYPTDRYGHFADWFAFRVLS